MDDLSGDWDLYVLTETGESLGASEQSQTLEEFHRQERVMVHLEPQEPVGMAACNWLGEPEVTVHFTFHRTFAPPEGLLAYATCPGADGPNLSCVEPEVGSIPAEAEVFTLSATGHMPRRVTHNDRWESFPVWSPDGGRAAGYGTTRRCGLYTLGLRTGETRRLVGARYPGRDYCPRPNDWSSDGKWILFATSSEEIGNVYKIRPNGRELTSLTHHDWDTWPSDPYFVGRDIVYVKSGMGRGSNGIARMDAHGRNKKWLKRGCVSTLAVSPDDGWIAYGCRPSPEVEGPYILYLMRPDGSTRIRIHRSADFLHNLVFSPDGTKTAFATLSEKADRLRVYDLVADALLDIPLPKGAAYPHDVTWSPSGTYLAYTVPVCRRAGLRGLLRPGRRTAGISIDQSLQPTQPVHLVAFILTSMAKRRNPMGVPGRQARALQATSWWQRSPEQHHIPQRRRDDDHSGEELT